MINDLPSIYTYAGDGAATEFPFPSPIGDPENIHVSLLSGDETTVLVYQRDYEVDSVQDREDILRRFKNARMRARKPRSVSWPTG